MEEGKRRRDEAWRTVEEETKDGDEDDRGNWTTKDKAGRRKKERKGEERERVQK